MNENELREIQQLTWQIKSIARAMNDTSDELKALREDLGIQPPRPQLSLVNEQADDDG